MDRRWVVHILDVRADDGIDRCARCGQPLDRMCTRLTPPGGLVASLLDEIPEQWRPILERDDLTQGEVSCDRIVGGSG